MRIAKERKQRHGIVGFSQKEDTGFISQVSRRKQTTCSESDVWGQFKTETIAKGGHFTVRRGIAHHTSANICGAFRRQGEGEVTLIQKESAD